MFKDMRLGMKLGLGFGVLVLITCCLGVLAVVNMRAVRAGSERLSAEDVPEVAIANNVERTAFMTMFAMRGYSMSERPAFWKEASERLSEVHAHLDEAAAHAEKYPDLVALKQSVDAAQTRIDEYTALAGQTDALIKELGTDRDDMNSAGATFIQNCNGYLAGQSYKMRELINGQGGPEELLGRLQNISAVNDLIGMGNEIIATNFKAQAMRDAKLMEDVLARFPKIDEQVQQMKAATTDDIAQRQLGAIARSAKDYKEAVAAYLEAWTKRRELDATRDKAASAVLDASRTISLSGIEHAQKVADGAVHSLSSAAKVVVGGLVAAVALGIAIALFLTRAITGPMARGVAYATKVADGDLDQVLDVHQQDEAGQLAAAMSRMVENLKEKIAEAEEQQQAAAAATKEAQGAMSRAQAKEQEVRGLLDTMGSLADQAQSISERMSSASEELAAQVEQVTRGTQEQSERMGETATAMEEMNATVMEVARNAADASTSAEQALGKAREGADVVGQAVSGIGEVHAITRDLQENMVDLGRKAESIGAVMNVISDIADQTNLLALNAAIEAARAGDAGRGFAVVADEVRKLAEKTMGATKEVGESIGSIQQAARQSQEKMQSAAKAVERVTEMAGRSGEALGEIVGLVGGSARQVEGIAAAAEQQSAASEEISRSIEQVGRIVSETAEGMEQSSRAVQEVAVMSGELNQLIVRLKQDGAA
ncbi:methyl-accepting chemotaxis sensory transducer [Desulfovibrio sp. X2]|uniref:methyl-accepting chemotaxis protein n=1 Tax=Desulfovibrio sp. X2 TaxID=941449 RepID=UPI000358A375|nr:methyl-accepting chemotaxis protein [Desulfovibrio sp. X2]EPR36333.1 methyl-accepting chemotaxis sensory transducer [Desulfovibrio sp. X2]